MKTTPEQRAEWRRYLRFRPTESGTARFVTTARADLPLLLDDIDEQERELRELRLFVATRGEEIADLRAERDAAYEAIRGMVQRAERNHCPACDHNIWAVHRRQNPGDHYEFCPALPALRAVSNG